jgi:hypothetical protein
MLPPSVWMARRSATISMLVDLLLVRQLQPLVANAGKHLVKAPKVEAGLKALHIRLTSLPFWRARVGP